MADRPYYYSPFGGDEEDDVSSANDLLPIRETDGTVTNIPNVAPWEDMDPQELLAYQALQDSRYTRDTNRQAVLGAFGDVQAGQAGATELANTLDLEAIAQQYGLSDLATGSLAANFEGQGAALGEATNQDYATLGQMGDLTALTGQREADALGGYQQNADLANQLEFQNLDALGGYMSDANASDWSALSGLNFAAQGANTEDQASLSGLTGAAQGANAADQQSLQYLRGVNDSLVNAGPVDAGADLTSAAAGAAADPGSIEAQRAALGEYQSRTGVEMTAQEKFMLELARRQAEQQVRAQQQAALKDLSARGMGGSGAELVALLGAQQNTAQDRMLADMAALANAQGRSERMLDSSADLASAMRGQSFGEQFQTGSASDSMAEFNRMNSIDTQKYNSELTRLQNMDAYNRAMGVTGTELGATQAAYGREGDVYDASRDVTADAYGRSSDLYGATRDVAADEYARGLTQYEAGADTVSGMWDRNNDVYGATSAANQAEWDRGAALADQAYGVTDQAYDRYADYYNTGYGLTDQAYGYGQDAIGQLLEGNENAYDRERDRQSNVFGATELYTGNQRSDQQNVNSAIETNIGVEANKDAIEALEEDTGLLGLGIGFL